MVEPTIAPKLLRVSYLAARVADGITDIGDPDQFEQRLLDRRDVCGLNVTLPWRSDVWDATREFWSHVAEQRRLVAPRDLRGARRLRRQSIPLRYRPPTTAVGVTDPLTDPRVEVLLHPFGWVCAASFDIEVPPPNRPSTLAEVIAEAESRDLEVLLSGSQVMAQAGKISDVVADALLNRLANRSKRSWDGVAHRVVTVIDADVSEPTNAMPSAASDLLSVLHRLSRGGRALGVPPFAFVARWTGTGFAWSPDDLVYSGNHGTAVFVASSSDQTTSRQVEKTADRHRRLTLLLGLLSANATLVHAATESEDAFLIEWGVRGADRLARMYGPVPAGSRYWGLEARQFIESTGANNFVETLRGEPLSARFPSPRSYS